MVTPFHTPQEARRWSQAAKAVGLVGAGLMVAVAGLWFAVGGGDMSAGFAVVVAAAVVVALLRQPGRKFLAEEGALLTDEQITQLRWESACGHLAADRQAQQEVMREAPTAGYFWVGGALTGASVAALLLGGLPLLATVMGLVLVTFVLPQAAWWGKARRGYRQVYSQAFNAATEPGTTADGV